jgi:hypothetical protein
MLLHLLRLLTLLLPAARRFNETSDLPSDLRASIDVKAFLRLINVQQLCFLAAQPLMDIKGKRR